MIDEWTRECLAIDVAGGIRSDRVIEVLHAVVSVDKPSNRANWVCDTRGRKRRRRISFELASRAGRGISVRPHEYLESRKKREEVFHRARG